MKESGIEGRGGGCDYIVKIHLQLVIYEAVASSVLLLCPDYETSETELVIEFPNKL